MKERTASAIKSDLMNIGLSASVADTFSGGSGLTGQAARQFCNNNKQLADLTKDQQLGLLKLIAPSYERLVKKYIKVNLRVHEYDALVCFVYNPGGRFPPVANMINDGKVDEAMAIIRSRVPSSGVNRNGLIARRNKETNLFVNGVYADVNEA
jgi:GH24 family phage-related lysozyme (muramidase)